MFEGMCIASIGLPDYDIKGITTWQYDSDEDAVAWIAGYNASAALELPRVAEKLRRDGMDPVVRSDFDVYLEDERLIYVRDSCTAENADAPFFLHLYPDDLDDLPPSRREVRFDSFSFDLLDRGVMVEGGCFTSFDLPDYKIAGFTTGQFVHGEGNLWEGKYRFAAAELPGIVEELRGRGVQPVIRSNFDVYLDEYRLIYFKYPCTTEDAAAPFFVHLYPDDLDDLPPPRREARFDSFSFDMLDQGVMVEGGCFTSFDLPDYKIAGLLTGQFVHGEDNLWENGHSFSAAELPGIVEELRGRGAEPVVRSYFDVYMDNDILIYVRDPCDASDIEAEFFLHVVPSSVDDLPPPRKESGFYNLDFIFETHGSMFGGMCIASAGLPDYKIERIRTGQWDSKQQRNVWKEEFDVVE